MFTTCDAACSSGVTRNNWFASQACRHGELDVDIIDLAQTWLPDVLTCDGSTPLPPVRDLAPWLAAADAFVIVTPEYNHSFPRVAEERHRLVRRRMGDQAGRIRVLRRPCRRSAGGRSAETGVHRTPRGERSRDRQLPRPPTAVRRRRPAHRPRRLQRRRQNLLDQLIWWALALRDARAKRPYDH